LSFSKVEVRETQLLKLPDTVLFRNESSRPARINLLEIQLDASRFPQWEFSLRAPGAPAELCFGRLVSGPAGYAVGKGAGACPPATPSGGSEVTWMIPPGDSLPLRDFNLAPCIRCLLADLAMGNGGASLRIPVILHTSGGRDTLCLAALLGSPADSPNAPSQPRPVPPSSSLPRPSGKDGGGAVPR
jgi:hypothetical protein